MTIHLTPEQERRLRAVLDRGAYKSVEEVVEAALTAVEQRTVPGFAGTPEELDTLLAEGLASKQLTEDEFWSSVSKRTDALLAEHKDRPPFVKVLYLQTASDDIVRQFRYLFICDGNLIR